MEEIGLNFSSITCDKQVKVESRRLQALFFQRMALSFPDVDFSSVKTRSLVALGQTANSSTPSPKQQPIQSRLFKPQDDVILASDSGPTKHLPRSYNAVEEDVREKSSQKENISKMQKEVRVMFGDRSQNRERCRGDEVEEVTHPGDLVICKKKRKDSDKVIAKARMVNCSPDICQGTRGLPQKDILIPGQARQVQGWPQFASAEKTGTSGLDAEKDVAQWARPVKRMRTDKRRPSHI
jgi:SWI/SNF-related matrix-associated actin-dependent regulator of chromatin subfamily A protein 2/4